MSRVTRAQPCEFVYVRAHTPAYTRASVEVSKLQTSVLQGHAQIVSAMGSVCHCVLSVPMPKWICSKDASC